MSMMELSRSGESAKLAAFMPLPRLANDARDSEKPLLAEMLEFPRDWP
jgi:hypothetical protein